MNCAACNRAIDAAAKLCPYCGANPSSGERVDTQSMLQEVFQPREVTASESVMAYARQRQGIVITISVFVALIVIAAVHQYITMRNSTAVTDAPAVPLTEITDITKKDEAAPVAMPALDFQYDGKPAAMRTYVVERGAVTPPEILGAQQAAAAAQAQAAAPVTARPVGTTAATPAPARAPAPPAPSQQR